MNKEVILVIEDEGSIRKLLMIALESEGFQVVQAASGKEGITLAASHQPSLILLDIGLPDQSGLAVLADLRIWFRGGIIIVSVLDDEPAIIKALDNGADDYLNKPFRTGELLARIRNVLRRKIESPTPAILHFRDLRIDIDKHNVFRNQQLIRLTNTEFKLLVLLVSNHGKMLTHAFILKSIWGASFSKETQYLRVFISQLRKKIETPEGPHYIQTESGIGYRAIPE